eukprot:COSAG04_NODE_673_length_11278_cov_15.174434_3_plen_69_part_00
MQDDWIQVNASAEQSLNQPWLGGCSVLRAAHTQLNLHADGVSMAASSNMNTFNQYDNSVAEFWKRACL